MTTPRTGPFGDERIGTAVRISSPPFGNCSIIAHLRCAPTAVRSASRSADAREYSRGSVDAATSTTGTTCGDAAGAGADAVDLDQLDAFLEDVGRHQIAHAPGIRRGEVERSARSRASRCACSDTSRCRSW